MIKIYITDYYLDHIMTNTDEIKCEKYNLKDYKEKFFLYSFLVNYEPDINKQFTPGIIKMLSEEYKDIHENNDFFKYFVFGAEKILSNKKFISHLSSMVSPIYSKRIRKDFFIKNQIPIYQIKNNKSISYTFNPKNTDIILKQKNTINQEKILLITQYIVPNTHHKHQLISQITNFLNIFPISHLKYLLPDAQIDKRTIQGNSQYDQFVRRELSYKSFTITEYKDKLLVIVKNILTSQNKKIEQSNLYIPEQKIYLNKIKYNYDFKNSYIFKK